MNSSTSGTTKRRVTGRALLAASTVLAAGLAGVATSPPASARSVDRTGDGGGTCVRAFAPPHGSDSAFGIVGALGAVWFAHGGTIDKIEHGRIKQYRLPRPADAGWLVADPVQPRIWFADRDGALGTIDGRGHVDEVRIPDGADGSSVPQGLVLTTAGVWFTDQTSARLGLYDPGTGAFTFYATPTKDSEPVGLALGTDGNLYAAERAVDQVARFDPRTGTFTEMSLPKGAFPNRFAVASNGGLWLTELGISSMARIAPNGHVRQRHIEGGPVGVVAYRGAFYTALYNTSQLGRVSYHGRLTGTWDLPDGAGVLQVSGYRGHLWMTDSTNDVVYRVDPRC